MLSEFIPDREKVLAIESCISDIKKMSHSRQRKILVTGSLVLNIFTQEVASQCITPPTPLVTNYTLLNQ